MHALSQRILFALLAAALAGCGSGTGGTAPAPSGGGAAPGGGGEPPVVLADGCLNCFPSVHESWSTHDLAADGAGLSENGQSVDDLRWFPNSADPGKGILAFRTDHALGGSVLWATFQDSGTFTPPREIVGEGQDDTSSVNLDQISVLWLNGVGHREGDALILFTRRSAGDPTDANDDGTHEDTGNERLYSCYFDQSETSEPVGTALDGSVLFHGFSAAARYVDADPMGANDDFDPDVDTGALVSDGNCFSAEVAFDAVPRSGDAVTFAYAVWTQQQDTSAVSPIERRLWYSPFDLAGTTTRFEPAAAQVVAPAAGIVFEGEDPTGSTWFTHNGLVIWTALASLGSDVGDNSLQGTVFGPGGPAPTQVLSRLDPDEIDLVGTAVAGAGDVYGPDHGLDRFWVFFVEAGFSEGGSGKTQDLMAATLSTNASSVEIAEIDDFLGVPAEPAASIFLPAGFSRISPCATRILVLWGQNHRYAAGGGEVPTYSAFLRAVATTAPGGLAAAVSGDLGVSGTAVRLNADVVEIGGDEMSRTVLDARFQHGLADGRSSPESGVQTSEVRSWVTLLQQRIDDVADPDDEDLDGLALLLSQIDLDAADPDAVTVQESLVDTVDRNWGISFEPAAVDDGQGGAIVYYLNQGNNKDDDEDNGADNVFNEFLESRLFAWRSGMLPGGIEISTDGDAFGVPDFFQVDSFRVVATPCGGCDAGGPTRHHIFVREDHGLGGPHGIRHRMLDLASQGPFAQQFQPPLASPPLPIDLGLPLDGAILDVRTDGDAVAVTMQIEGHLYYNAFEPGQSWFEEGGFPDPDWVDHDSGENVVGAWVLPANPCAPCATIAGAVFAWTKAEADGDVRLHARVHR